MNGQIGHGRNLVQSVNFTLQEKTFLPNACGTLPGWGTDKKDLRQTGLVHYIRTLPME